MKIYIYMLICQLQNHCGENKPLSFHSDQHMDRSQLLCHRPPSYILHCLCKMGGEKKKNTSLSVTLLDDTSVCT